MREPTAKDLARIKFAVGSAAIIHASGENPAGSFEMWKEAAREAKRRGLYSQKTYLSDIAGYLRAKYMRSGPQTPNRFESVPS